MRVVQTRLALRTFCIVEDEGGDYEDVEPLLGNEFVVGFYTRDAVVASLAASLEAAPRPCAAHW